MLNFNHNKGFYLGYENGAIFVNSAAGPGTEKCVALLLTKIRAQNDLYGLGVSIIHFACSCLIFLDLINAFD